MVEERYLNWRLLVVFVFINFQFIRANVKCANQQQQSYYNHVRIFKMQMHNYNVFTKVRNSTYFNVKTALNLKGFIQGVSFFINISTFETILSLPAIYQRWDCFNHTGLSHCPCFAMTWWGILGWMEDCMIKIKSHCERSVAISSSAGWPAICQRGDCFNHTSPALPLFRNDMAWDWYELMDMSKIKTMSLRA